MIQFGNYIDLTLILILINATKNEQQLGMNSIWQTKHLVTNHRMQYNSIVLFTRTS